MAKIAAGSVLSLDTNEARVEVYCCSECMSPYRKVDGEIVFFQCDSKTVYCEALTPDDLDLFDDETWAVTPDDRLLLVLP